jgi:hypothetical protein
MSGLKPIGSEKLQGMDKIRRIMEIARFNENLPQSINETAKSEYKIYLADGNTYEIVRERQGYIIKSSINESENEYIEPIQERKYFSSYSQALKRLNLMAKELNELYENEEGVSLIGEQKKKFILKTKKKKTADTPTPVSEPLSPPPSEPLPPPPSEPLPPPADFGSPMGGPTEMPEPPMGGPTEMPEPPMGGSEMPEPPMGGPTEMPEPPMGGSEMPEPPMGDEMPEPPIGDEMPEPPMGDEEGTSDSDMGTGSKPKKVSDFKRIQILVGKLAQKIRTFEESDDLSPKDIKYIINSILSAIDVNTLDEDDIEQIISKLEGTEEDDEDKDFSDEDNEESPEERPEETPDGEVGEGFKTYGDAFDNYVKGAVTSRMSDGLKEDEYGVSNTDKDFQKYYREGEESDPSQVSLTDFEDYDDMPLRRKLRQKPSNSFYHLNHGTYNESKIDKILNGYFKITENEIKQKYSNLVENNFQFDSVKNFLLENQNATYMGKTIKGNLIFKNGNKDVKITKSGTLL